MYATDRDTYVVQGWKVAEAPDQVEIPHRLLGHLELGSVLGARLSDTGRGSFTLCGRPVDDNEALAQMMIPGHETCIEVPRGEEVWSGGAAAG